MKYYRAVGLFVLAALVLLALVAPALAHEPRVVGPYQIAFGWRTEPVYTGLLNGPEIFISMAKPQAQATAEATPAASAAADDEGGAPLPADVAVDLKVVVSSGGLTMNVPMRPADGEIGHLIGDLIPTRPGDYSFHVTGTIGDTAVDETFTSADGKFDTVEPVSDIQFPPPEATAAS